MWLTEEDHVEWVFLMWNWRLGLQFLLVKVTTQTDAPPPSKRCIAD